jgi:phospholipase C
MPKQESGTRPARALPYALTSRSRIDPVEGKVWIEFRNEGKAGVALYASNNRILQGPRRYSISAQQSLSDYWLVSDTGSDLRPKQPRSDPDYDISCDGPNGFLAHFRGIVVAPPSPDPEDNVDVKAEPNPELILRYDHQDGDVYLTIANLGAAPCTLLVTNAYAMSEAPHRYTLKPGAVAEDHWALAASYNWFDLTISSSDSPTFLRRFAGHVETGRASTSDPAAFIDEPSNA